MRRSLVFCWGVGMFRIRSLRWKSHHRMRRGFVSCSVKIRTRRAGDLVTLLSCHVANAQKQSQYSVIQYLGRSYEMVKAPGIQHYYNYSLLAMTWRQSHLCPSTLTPVVRHRPPVIAGSRQAQPLSYFFPWRRKTLFKQSQYSDYVVAFSSITDDTINPGVNH